MEPPSYLEVTQCMDDVTPDQPLSEKDTFGQKLQRSSENNLHGSENGSSVSMHPEKNEETYESGRDFSEDSLDKNSRPGYSGRNKKLSLSLADSDEEPEQVRIKTGVLTDAKVHENGLDVNEKDDMEVFVAENKRPRLSNGSEYLQVPDDSKPVRQTKPSLRASVSVNETTSLMSDITSEILYEEEEEEVLSDNTSGITELSTPSQRVYERPVITHRPPRSISECIALGGSNPGKKRGRFMVQKSESLQSSNTDISMATLKSRTESDTDSNQVNPPQRKQLKKQVSVRESSGDGGSPASPGCHTRTTSKTDVSCDTRSLVSNASVASDGHDNFRGRSKVKKTLSEPVIQTNRAKYLRSTSKSGKKSKLLSVKVDQSVDTDCQTSPSLVLPSGKVLFALQPHETSDEVVSLQTRVSPNTNVVTTSQPVRDDTDGSVVKPPMPKDYLLLACIVMWCCNLPLGVAAFILSIKSESTYKQGDYRHSYFYSKSSLAASVTGILVTTFLTVTLLVIYWPSQVQTQNS